MYRAIALTTAAIGIATCNAVYGMKLVREAKEKREEALREHGAPHAQGAPRYKMKTEEAEVSAQENQYDYEDN
ncbi:hypothetical protein M8J76_016924 [Diaphorina citri]|nr:hypothetical protein M8J75_005283 [Diaphorina citri]KAI5730744.1 hypothetical protein M8J76_016924 [Diaphorina citri]